MVLHGNLQDARQHKFGYQLTIFRQGVQFTPAQQSSRWAVRDFYFGHFTISDLEANQFHVAERVSRGALGERRFPRTGWILPSGPGPIQQDGASERFHLARANRTWRSISRSIRSSRSSWRASAALSRKADGVGRSVLLLFLSAPRHGRGSCASAGRPATVTGQSWFDHEFSTSSLGKDQVGWDWFCLQLDNHEEIMLYAMRDKSGAMDPVSEGTWVKADGTSERLAPGSFSIEKKGTWPSPRSGAIYPAGWHIVVPGHRANLTVTPRDGRPGIAPDKMGALDYWEGACTASGHVGDISVTGTGYTELTGYAGALQAGMKE